MARRRPSIYIGLGGTGIKAIAKTKKLYEEEFGKKDIPPEIAFLAIDFDKMAVEDKELPTDIKNDFLQLVAAVNPREHYRVQRESFNEYEWMFSQNSSYVDNLISNGAKQVRTTGRLYTEIVIEQIKAKIQNCYNKVLNIATSRGYHQAVDIHLVMSLAGGTGAGSFITVALLIDQLFGNKINLYGYGVLHGVFQTMDPAGAKTPRVFSNSYSSIVDLDYLLHATNENPISIKIGKNSHTVDYPIFKEFYTINNATESGKIVSTCRQLCEVIGTCLYVSGNDLGNNKDSLASNIGWREGDRYNVQSKKGWAYALGACQIVYKGQELAETYAYKASKELIRKMSQVSADIEQKALDWTEENLIREDSNRYNMLTDWILSPQKIASIRFDLLDSENTESANQEITKQVISTFVEEYPSKEKLDAFSENLNNNLSKRIDDFLLSDNGLGDAGKFLDRLKSLCEGYKKEMNEEKNSFQKLVDKAMSELENQWKEYEKEKKTGFFISKKKEKNQELLEDLIARPVKEIRKNRHEAKRREDAAHIYIKFLAKIDELLDKVTNIRQQIEAIDKSYSDKLLLCQKETVSSLVFEYDLSYAERVSMQLDNSEILLSDFTATLGEKKLIDIDRDQLQDVIFNYAINLPKSKSYRDKLITDVIDNLDEKEYQHLKDEISELSSLLMNFDGRGMTIDGTPIRDKMVRCYMVASYGDDNTQNRFERDIEFLPQIIDKEFTKINSDVMKQKVICYRVDGAILPYCLGPFDAFSVKRDYEDKIIDSLQAGSTTFNPHFDAKIYEDMRRNDFKLKPEMQNQAMFYWVCGQLFGWTTIKEEERAMKTDDYGNATAEDKENTSLEVHTKYIACIKKKYYWWDPNAVAGRIEKWQPLDNTSVRDSAFNYFKTIVLPNKKDLFNNLVKSEFQSKGKQYFEHKINEISKAGLVDYINKVLCTDKSSTTYFTSGSAKADFELIQKEFDYLQKYLFNALSNLK